MHRVFLCLGGNKGDVCATFYRVICDIEERVGKVMNQSSLYKTSSWGDKDQDDYLNQVVEVSTTLSPLRALEKCLQIEKDHGRFRDINNQWASRTIDIDILLYNDEQIIEETLIIPHQRMLERNFVMIPLDEIAGDIVHPVKNEKISALKKQTNDSLKVECITITSQ